MSFLRFLIFLFISLGLAWLYHFIFNIQRYGTGYSLNYMSDALFIIGAFGFLPALMMHLGTYRFFYGMQYALKSMFNTDFKQKYRQFGDFLIDKKTDASTTIYLELMFASLILIALSIVFALSWSRSL